MRKKITFLITMLFLFAFQSIAQVSNVEDKNKGRGNAVRILRFENPEIMFEILNGKWVFNEMTCESPYTVEVSQDKKTIKFTVKLTEKEKKAGAEGETRSFIYDVLEVKDYYIRTQIQKEKRKTDNGKVVKWDFMFSSRNKFYWHRTDWRNGGITPPVERCIEDRDNLALR